MIPPLVVLPALHTLFFRKMLRTMRMYQYSMACLIALGLLTQSTFADTPVDMSGKVQTADGAPICAMVLTSGKYNFSCNQGAFSLTGLPREPDGTVTRQIYADGFFPRVVQLPESWSESVVMRRASGCSNYNSPSSPSVSPGSAGKRVSINGRVLRQNSEEPVCAMVLANGSHMFSCDNTGNYSLEFPLDSKGQYQLQVYANGFAPTIQTFDEFANPGDVRMAAATECQGSTINQLLPLDADALDTRYRSINSDQPTTIQFKNNENFAVNIYWIGYSGERVLFLQLDAGANGFFSTFMTHAWIVAKVGSGDTLAQGTGELLVGFLPENANANQVTADIALIDNANNPPPHLLVVLIIHRRRRTQLPLTGGYGRSLIFL